MDITETVAAAMADHNDWYRRTTVTIDYRNYALEK
jgi:hypothetical protein